MKIPVPDRDVSGLLEGGVLLELLGRVKAKQEMEAPEAARPRRQGSGLMRNTLLHSVHT